MTWAYCTKCNSAYDMPTLKEMADNCVECVVCGERNDPKRSLGEGLEELQEDIAARGTALLEQLIQQTTVFEQAVKALELIAEKFREIEERLELAEQMLEDLTAEVRSRPVVRDRRADH